VTRTRRTRTRRRRWTATTRTRTKLKRSRTTEKEDCAGIPLLRSLLLALEELGALLALVLGLLLARLGDDLIQGALAEDEPTTKSTKAGKKQSEDKGKKSAVLVVAVHLRLLVLVLLVLVTGSLALLARDGSLVRLGLDLDDLIQGALAEDEPTTKSTKAGKKQSEDKGKKRNIPEKLSSRRGCFQGRLCGHPAPPESPARA
jgi:hypothetical protein